MTGALRIAAFNRGDGGNADELFANHDNQHTGRRCVRRFRTRLTMRPMTGRRFPRCLRAMRPDAGRRAERQGGVQSHWLRYADSSLEVAQLGRQAAAAHYQVASTAGLSARSSYGRHKAGDDKEEHREYAAEPRHVHESQGTVTAGLCCLPPMSSISFSLFPESPRIPSRRRRTKDQGLRTSKSLSQKNVFQYGSAPLSQLRLLASVRSEAGFPVVFSLAFAYPTSTQVVIRTAMTGAAMSAIDKTKFCRLPSSAPS